MSEMVINPFNTSPMMSIPVVKHSDNNIEYNSEENNSFMKDLREFMDECSCNELGISMEDDISSSETAPVMTKEKANIYLSLYNKTLEEIEEINLMCDKEIERTSKMINAFREKRLKDLNGRNSYFKSILEEFAKGELEGKRTKTLKLPYGNLSLKKQTAKFIFDDDLLEEVRSIDPSLIHVKTTESVNKTDIKKKGTIIDGNFYLEDKLLSNVHVFKQEDKFEIK